MRLGTDDGDEYFCSLKVHRLVTQIQRRTVLLFDYGTPIISIIDRPKSAAFINRSCNCRVLSSIDHATVGCFHQSITINRLLLMD